MAYVVKRVDYSFRGRDGKTANWTACIAGRDTDEILKYLRGVVRQDIKVTQISEIGRLDAVTDELRQIIAKPIVEREITKVKKVGKKPGPGRPRKNH